MLFLKISAGCWFGICALLVIGFACGSKHPIRRLLCNALLGLAGLAAVRLCARFTGVTLPLNPYTLLSAGVFGLPAVCGLLVLRFLF